MAKKGQIESSKRKLLCMKKHEATRAMYAKMRKDITIPMSQRREAQESLNKLNRNSSKVRQRKMCALTGRRKGFVHKMFPLCRMAFRDAAVWGMLPGVRISSW